jgi:hypothetical protein
MNKYIETEGTFIARVKQPGNGWFGNSKNGNRFIRVPLLVVDAGGSEDGKECVWYGNINDNVGKDGKTGTERTIAQLEDAFGIDWDWEHINFVDKLCKVDVQESTDKEGKTKYRGAWIRNINDSDGSNDEAQASSLSIAKDLSKEIPLNRGKKPAPKKTTKELAEQDDIPF